MTTPKTAGVSLASLNVRKVAPAEFEYVNPEGVATGLFFTVLGSHTDAVTEVSNRLVNERRQAQSAQESAALIDRRANAYTPIEDDIAFGQRLAAIRLAGWRGIDEPFSPENALVLCQGNPDIAAWVMQKSNSLGFTSKASLKVS